MLGQSCKHNTFSKSCRPAVRAALPHSAAAAHAALPTPCGRHTCTSSPCAATSRSTICRWCEVRRLGGALPVFRSLLQAARNSVRHQQQQEHTTRGRRGGVIRRQEWPAALRTWAVAAQSRHESVLHGVTCRASSHACVHEGTHTAATVVCMSYSPSSSENVCPSSSSRSSRDLRGLLRLLRPKPSLGSSTNLLTW